MYTHTSWHFLLLPFILFPASGKPVILLLFNAGPLDITWAKLNSGVHVIIECFFPAQATGEALARTFMNEGEAANPAARLPSTWPTNLQQVSIFVPYWVQK